MSFTDTFPCLSLNSNDGRFRLAALLYAGYSESGLQNLNKRE